MKESKSILIIDTPTSCVLCPMSYYNECHNEHYCIHSDHWQLIKDYNRQRRHTESDDIRPSWCPLSPLPEPKDLTKYTIGSTSLDKVIQYAHDQGYNDCLYDLNGGDL
jgi:hypothetical protein